MNRIQLVVHLTGGGVVDHTTTDRDSSNGSNTSSKPYTDNHDDDDDSNDTNDYNKSDVEDMEDTSTHSSQQGAGVPFSPSRFTIASTKVSGNVFRTVTFSIIAWFGLFIVWYFYYNYQEKKKVMQRFYAPVAIAIVAMCFAFVVNVFPSNVSMDEDIMDTDMIITNGKSRRREGGTIWNSVQVEDDLDSPRLKHFGNGSAQSSGLEMTPLGDKEVINEGNNEEVQQSTDQLVTLVRLVGRPNVRELVHSAVSASFCPAILCCAPESITKEVRDITKGKCGGACSNVALYNEAFEM